MARGADYGETSVYLVVWGYQGRRGYIIIILRNGGAREVVERRSRPISVESRVGLTNRWSQPLAVVKSVFDFMKQFSVFAMPALASGGSACSR